MKLSVVIPTYHRAQILERCLKALEDQTFSKADFEVVIVNDGSPDQTESLLKKWEKNSDLNLTFFTQKNAGQGAARNRALKHAKGNVIVLIGDDMFADRNFLTEHWKSHSENPQPHHAVLGLIKWHPDLKPNAFMKWMTNGSSIFGKFGGHQFAYEKLERGQTPDYNFFYTSNLSLKRKFLGDDPFDLTFSKYGWEDIELGYRLQKEQAMTMSYNKNAITYHYHPMDASGLAKRMEFIGRSAHVIDAKHPELKKVPSLRKKIAFILLSNPASLGFIKLFNGITRGHLQALYYYALSKKYFLKGVRLGYNEHKSKD